MPIFLLFIAIAGIAFLTDYLKLRKEGYTFREYLEEIRTRRFSPFQIIFAGFLLIILIGAGLLMLPVASREGGSPSFIDALFTAVSAVCVTGLIVKDTATYWTEFGQTVILLLIQIGGLGIATWGVAGALLRQKRIGLSERILMKTAISQNTVGGIVKMTKFLIKVVVIAEGTGAVLLAFFFCSEMGIGKGVWYGLFHSISAFCNAGFDLMGIREPFSSLTSFVSNGYVTGIVMLLIIVGGLGFLTWRDVVQYRFRIRKYCLQSRIILFAYAVLILLPAVCFFFLEFQDFPLGTRILASLFQAVTPRTAGFNTMPLDQMSESAQLLMILLMLIGGAPGSTAGGMKVTTFVLLIALLINVFQRSGSVRIFRRRAGDETMRQATALFVMYLFLFAIGGAAISRIDQVPIMSALFESASALGTVGLTLGITPALSTASKLILTAYMFIGRVGSLTIIYALIPRKIEPGRGLYPEENIAVG